MVPKFLYKTATGEACVLGPDGETKYYLISESMYQELKQLIEDNRNKPYYVWADGGSL